MNSKTLTNIQALRAFAALNVVFFHVIAASKSYDCPVYFFDFLEGWGHNGVDLFFVISGFVMVYIQRLKKKTPYAFFRDRVVRIIPTYWLLSTLLVGLLLAMPSLFRNMEFSVNWAFASFLFLSTVLVQSPPILYVGWTIEYEMFFYFVFATSLFLKPFSKSLAITISIIVLVVIFFGANSILLEFIFGMIVGCGFFHITPSYRVAQVSLIFGIAAFLLSLWFKDWGTNRVVIFGLPSMFIVFGCINLSQVKTSILTKLGDASYSIYLVQVFTIPAFYKVATKINLFSNNDLLALFCLLLSTLTGLFVYQTFEVRVSTLLKKRNR
jgi:exopolysaccharide production protein ExoZ